MEGMIGVAGEFRGDGWISPVCAVFTKCIFPYTAHTMHGSWLIWEFPYVSSRTKISYVRKGEEGKMLQAKKWITLPLCLAIGISVQSIAANPFQNDREEHVVEEDFTPRRGKYAPTATQGWYYPHRTDGLQPPIPAEMQYIEKYGGYCIDRKHDSMEEGDRVIYLTFDAGYENGNVARVLDVLKDKNVPAAFFILENLVTSNTALVQRMAEEGHLVCNHTAHHHDMTKMDRDGFAAELSAMEQVYTEKTGVKLAPYYRPPEGKTNEDNLRWADAMGYKTIFWSYAYADWDNERQMDPKKALDKLLAELHNGEVLLLHPTSATNAAILSAFIDSLVKKGFRFGTLDELTGASELSNAAEACGDA